MKKKYIVIFLVLMFVCVAYVVLQGDYKIMSKPTVNDATNTTPVSGTLLRGEALGIDYCSDGYYLQKTDGSNVLLRENTPDTFTMYRNEALLGTQVILTLKFPQADTVRCEATLCECEDWAMVVR